ncbi:MAG: hydrogenase nickel incorporation protein HypB [Chromatiales bacterium]|jgi:hydrogenase nickel incorporation protein HypB
MCETCGCNVTAANRHLVEDNGKLAQTADGKAAVDVLHSLLHENDHQAMHNREHFDQHKVLAINLMSSPGSGKTTLLEQTIEALGDELNIAVIEGDLETENDANRIRAKGIDAVQITTGSACHLDAHMVHDGLHQLALDNVDILFIENVGNLVCPASFDLGHHLNVTLLSTTEGDDKPSKYPVMFRAADLMLISKADLLAVLDDFDSERATENFRKLAKAEPVISLSAKNRAGFDAWTDWLQQQLQQHRERLASGDSRRPAIQPDGVQLHSHTHQHSQGHQHDHGHSHGHHHHHEHSHKHGS